MAELSPVQALPSGASGVRRWLARDERGRLVEVADVGEVRAERLPRGGVFEAVAVAGGGVVFEAELRRRLVDLRPPPAVVVGLADRVLRDLETLHLAGGAHGALHLDGWGVDASGGFVVRPVFAVKPRDAAPTEQDVAAVGEAVAALAGREALEAAGFARAAAWLRGAGVGQPRVGDRKSVV